MSKSVIHLTSAHHRHDTRIFIKMCSSLARSDYDVSLIVADGLGSELKNNVSIIDIGFKSSRRFLRMTKTVVSLFNKAKDLNGDIYHLHDPELMPIGIKLKKLGKIVIFDAHEDLPNQILGKSYLSKSIRFFLSKVFLYYEYWVCPKFDAIIAATPFIRDKFLKINPSSIDINNFPLLGELSNNEEWINKQNEIVYVGSISKIRGIEEAVAALNYTTGVRLNLAGQFSERVTQTRVKNHSGWLKVNELGFLDRQQVCEVLTKSKAGLVTLHPTINYIDALPVKMFEYMAAGIPVIASNFPVWNAIIDDAQCGLCVDPLEPKAIGEAIQYLIDYPEEAEKMGKNGRVAIEEKYNWVIEEKKLLKIYKGLLP
jgi:glycosyltransferase involved in cell wall biosynthesis